ncbi:PREDICTED: probable adenylate kinase 6, chloroplastic isoform X1 [Theobroma cacao]|uniref:adenylate kinase n=1 Tax=Theobroma cacao TaxID=3641 RepID=A0AB32X335_THECC|nr:PREDICTED: probable adenylate kinase 6, chloroplastic isoform X1 [Theobroma cacao]
MAVLSRCSRAATAATTRTQTATATFSCILRALSPSFCSSSALNSETDLSNKKPAVLGTLKREPTGRNVQWVFLGCPGVGKGTYASRLSNLLGVPHIATGDLVRDELASSGPLSSQVQSFLLKEIVNQGKLVSDEIIIELLSKRLEAGEAKGESGFILDGFPRTIRQAEILEGVTDIELVVNLKLREEALLAKCLGRRICSECGGNYNVACIDIKAENGRPGMYMAPLPPPPQCATKLITRADDTEEVVKERLRIYHEMTQPVEEFYRSRGKLLEFDLPGGIPESWPKLLRALNLEYHEDKQSAAA